MADAGRRGAGDRRGSLRLAAVAARWREARRPAGETVLASGQVAFDDDLVAQVTVPVAGRVTRVLAHSASPWPRGRRWR